MRSRTEVLVYAAVFLALGVVVPMAFHLTFGVVGGQMFLPMPFVVLLASLVVGPVYGLVLGAVTPLISFFITAMPPAAILPFMLVELIAYGFLAGFFKNVLKIKTFLSLILAMVSGRIVLGLFVALFGKQLGLTVTPWSYVVGALVTGIPGIALQIIFIPIIAERLKLARNAENF